MFDVGFGLIFVFVTFIGGTFFLELLEKKKFLSAQLQTRLEIATMIIIMIGSVYLVIVGVRLLYLGVDNTGFGQGYSGRHGLVILLVRYFPYISTGVGAFAVFGLLRKISYTLKKL